MKTKQLSKVKLNLAIAIQNGEKIDRDNLLNTITFNPFDVLIFDIDCLMIYLATQINCRVNLKKRIVTTTYNRDGYKFEYFLQRLENNAMYYLAEQEHKVEVL